MDEAGGAGVQQVGGGGAVALAGELVAAGPGPGAEVGALGEQHQLLRGLALVVCRACNEGYAKVPEDVKITVKLGTDAKVIWDGWVD